MESQLMVQAFPEEQKRRQHIIDNQIYGFATSGIAATLVRRQLYDDPALVKNIYFTTAKDIVKEIQGAFSNMKFEILSAVWIQSHDSSPLQAGGWAAAKTRWYRPRRGRLHTEVHASFASEKVKKMPAVKNGFKIEIFNVPTSWSWRCSPITLLFSFLFGIAFQPSTWYNNGSITREAYR